MKKLIQVFSKLLRTFTEIITFPCHIRDLEFPTFAQVGMREELQKLRKDHAERVQELQGAAEQTVVIPTQCCKDQINE